MVNEKSAEETCNITPFVIFFKKLTIHIFILE